MRKHWKVDTALSWSLWLKPGANDETTVRGQAIESGVNGNVLGLSH